MAESAVAGRAGQGAVRRQGPRRIRRRARTADTDHTGTLTPLRRVVSAEPVLRPAVAELAALLAERYAGTRADVIRLAVPPRHATTEKQPSAARGAGGRRPRSGRDGAGVPTRRRNPSSPTSPTPVRRARCGRRCRGRTGRTCSPRRRRPRWQAGGGACSVVPDQRDVARVDAALTAVLGPGHHVVLTAGAGPARRYREFLAVSRGTRRIVVGTRAAAFAPVHDLGLVAIWDDGDDLHAEPRAPYPHAREVLLTRATVEGAAALVGGFARSVEAEQLLATAGPTSSRLPGRRSGQRSPCQSPVAPTSSSSATRSHGPPGCPSRSPTRLSSGLDARPRAGAHAPARVRRVPGVRALPHAGPVRASAPARSASPDRRPRRRAAGAARSSTPGPAPPADIEVCEHRSSGSGVPPRSWAAPSPRHRSWPPGGDHVVAVGAGQAGDRGRHAGRRAGRRGRLRRRGRARHLARAGPPRPAHRGGGAAPVVRRGRAGGAGRLGAWSSATLPCPVVQALVRWDPSGFARRESSGPGRGPPASGQPAGDDHRRAGGGRRRADPARPAAGHRGARAGARSTTAPHGVVVRVPRAQGPALSRALGEVQRVRSARKLDAVRIQVDPLTL